MSEFRIEIPIDVTTNANVGELQQLENALNKIYSAFQKNRTAAQGVFDQAASGAGRAASAIGQVDTAAEQAAQAFTEVGNAANAAGSEGQAAAQEAGQAAEQLEDSVGEAADAYEEVGDAAQQAGSESGSAFTQASNNVDQFTQRVEKSERTLREAFREKIQLILEALDKASPALKNIANTLKGLTAKAWHVAVKMTDLVTAPFRKIKDLITSPIVMTLSMAGISLGASSFINTFKDFSAGMSNVKALSGATEEEFQRLTATAEELGATTKFTATQAAEGMQYLAMAGWEADEVIDAMPGLLQLAAAGNTDLGTSADIVSDVMTAMGMSASDATRAADVFARTATSTNTTISMMGETLKYAAPAAKAFGMQIEDVATLTGMMANAGVKGSSAGTALRTALLRMASPTADAAKAMQKLGISFDDGKGNMKDMRTIMSELTIAFGKLGNQERLAMADDLFGKNASTAWLAVLDQGIDKFDELSESIYNSKGAAQEMAEIQLDNLQGDLTLLQSAVDGMKISLTKELDPYLRSGVQWLTGKIPEITEKLQGMLKTGLEKAKELKNFIGGVFDSADFQNADGFAGKFFVAWDKIIAEPFQKWWDGGGQQTILNAVGKMGKGLGELYHGIISGIFAALKGEDIDFEGLNITGLAKAGAEAAKEFVSAFMEEFDIKGLFGEMPGLLKTGVLGYLGISAGGTALSLAKDISMVKIAFSGVAKAAPAATSSLGAVGASAASAAGSAGSAVGALGGLKAALAAIPVWGWVAAAALAAVAIGVVAYNNAQKRHEQEILHFADAGAKAAEQYKESANAVRDAAETIDAIHEVKLQIQVRQDKQANQDNIQQTKAELAEVQDRIVWLEARLADTSLTEEDIANYKNQLAEIKSRKEYIEAQLASGTLTADEVAAYQAELEVLEGKEAELNAALAAGTLTASDVAAYQAELETLKGKEAELKAILAADSITAEQVQTYASQLAVLKSREEEIKVALASGTLTPEEAAQYESELEIIKTREEKLSIKLEGLGLTTAGIAFATSLVDSIDGKTAEVKVIMGKGSLTKAQIDEYTSQLAEIHTREAEIEVLQAGASLSPTEVAEYSAALEGIKNRTAEIEAKLAEGGLTEDQVKALSDEYSSLKNQEAALTLMLSGQSLNEDQLAAIAAEYATLEDKRAEINAELNEAGLSIGDLEKIAAAMTEIGDKQAVLNFEFGAGSLTADDLEAYNKQLSDLYGHLAELTGGVVSKEDLETGVVSEEEARSIVERRANTDLIKLQTEVEAARATIPEAVASRDKYLSAASTEEAAEADAHRKAIDIGKLEEQRRELNAERDLMEGREARGEISTDAYLAWEEETYKPGIWGMQDEYKAITGGTTAPQYGFLETAETGFDATNWQETEAWHRSEKERFQGLADTQGASLVQQYQNEKALVEGQHFNGTELAGYSLEEVAANYQQLDDVGKQIFQDAVTALNELNAQADYVGEEDKTRAMDVVDIAAKAEVMQQVQQQVQATADSYSAMDESQKAAFAASEEGKAALAGINEALEAIGGQDISSLDEINSALEQIQNADLSSFSLADAQAAFVALGGDASGAKTSVDALKTALQNLDGTTATTTVTNNVYNNTYNTTTTKAAQNANGGIYDGAMLSWVAEDGPEAIIPLGAKRRDRGIDLWLQAGEMLGVAEFAEGGIMEPYGNALEALPESAFSDDDSPAPAPVPVGGGSNGGGGGNTFTVSVEANPTFQIEGGTSADEILDKLKEKQRELAELFGGAIADQLEDIVSNMV